MSRSQLFGTLFHKSAELAYNHLSSNPDRIITREAIESLLREDNLLIGFVKQAFTDEIEKTCHNCDFCQLCGRN